MSKLSKFGKRQKNKWRRELENYVTERINEQLRKSLLKDEYVDFETYQRNLEDYTKEILFGYEDWDYWDYMDDIEEIDNWSIGWNCSDEPDYTEIWVKLAPGTHVKTETDYWLVTTCGFANLRTGEIKHYIGNYEIVLK